MLVLQPLIVSVVCWLDHRAISGTQAREASKAQFERDMGCDRLPLGGESKHLAFHWVIIAPPDLSSEYPAPSNGKRSAPETHAIRDAGQHHLPVFWAQAGKPSGEAKVVSDLFSRILPLGA